MTVATSFFSWQTSVLDWRQAPYESMSPNLLALRAYLLNRWGGQYLGGHNNRAIRGGSSVSTHAYGAALDWRYEASNNDREPGRARLLAEVIPWLIEWSAELGIDAIHDYVGSRIWRAGRTSSTNPDDWWRSSSGSQMGETWAQWLHIETHRDSFSWSTPIETRLAASPTPTPGPIHIEGVPDVVYVSREINSDTIWVSGSLFARYGVRNLDQLELFIIGGAFDVKTGKRLEAKGAAESWKQIKTLSKANLDARMGKALA